MAASTRKLRLHQGCQTACGDASTDQLCCKSYTPRVTEALGCLRELVIDGLRHGHFDFGVSCETGNKGRRLLIIRAGKSHKFSILKEEVPR